MDENQCNLRWNNHTFTFVNLLDHFRMRELYCDATIACNGMVYPVHKVVLSACSNFFESIFVNTNHQNPVVVLQDVGRVQLENLLTYMYRGEVRIPQPDLPMFIKVAESLQVKGLAIPTPDRYPPRQAHGPWHNSLCSPQEGIPSSEASVPHLSYRHEIPNRTLNCHDVVPDVKQNEPDLPRSYESEHIKHPQQNDLPLKRRHHVLEHTQNFRQESIHPKRPDEVEHIQQPWHKECSLRTAQEVDHPPRKLSVSSNNIPVEEKSSPVSGLIVSASQGTFQNLVASEEHRIKDEPEDSPDELDQNSLCISEEIEDPQDDDEFALKISDDQGNHSESYQSNRTITDQQHLELDCHELGVESAAFREPSGTPPQNSTASQLRRELLRPLQHKSGLPQIQQPNVQSIPHPVIAPREPERSRREPPPLMKIPPQLPTVMSDCDPPRRSHDGLKELQESNHSSHLLVKAPPTYRSYTAPNHFSLQVHNQQLGPVMVNGGSPIPETCLDSQMNNIMLPQIDAPLNLSGQRKFPDDSQKKSKDPFLGKILTNRKKRLRGPKSWEYLVRLLKDPTTNPYLIRWENEATGIFRLVQPAAIAQRWGRRTGKHSSECLSYENFARGLRYHYATGALMPVSERSFVYKFGPKALRTLEECDVSSFPSI